MLIVAELHPVIVFALVALFVVVSAMLMLAVLIQRPQGGGLSEAFGSASGSGHTAFGAKTGDALTTATISIFILFLLTAVGLNFIVKPPSAVSLIPTIQTPAGATLPDLPPTTIPSQPGSEPAANPQPAPTGPTPAGTGDTGAQGSQGEQEAKPSQNPSTPPATEPASPPPAGGEKPPDSAPQDSSAPPPR